MKNTKMLLPLAVLAILAVAVVAWYVLAPAGEKAAAVPSSSQVAETTAPAQGAAGQAETAQSGGPLQVTAEDRVLGEPTAPITIIEYASLTCSHCGSFHQNTLPQVKSDWLDTGKARLVYRHLPLDGVALRAASVAECLESDKAFFGFLDVLFQNQRKWTLSNDPMAEIAKYARFAGLGEERFQACANDEAAMQKILAGKQTASEAFAIQSTPSFLVNGKLISGDRSYEEFRQVLTEAQGAG